MAAQYTEVTLEDMKRTLKRRFRSYRPRQDVSKGMYVFDLKIDDHVGIRIWTSITARRGVGKDVGESAIRIHLISLQQKKPLQSRKNKPTIVKRTQNWADNLERRVNELVLKYNDSADFWSDLAMERDGVKPSSKPEVEPEVESAEPPEGDVPQKPRYSGPPVSDPQVKYLVSLIITARDAGHWEKYAKEFDLPTGYITKGHIKDTLTGGRDGTASKLISVLKEANQGYGQRRYAETEASLGRNDPIAFDESTDLFGPS